jgi:hypothetical protein
MICGDRGTCTGIDSITTISGGQGINTKSQILSSGSSGSRILNFGYGVTGATESARIEQRGGGLEWVTNAGAGGASPFSDNTKASWWMFLPNGGSDSFYIKRAPAGSTTYSDYLTIDASGNVGMKSLTLNGGSALTKVLATTVTLNFGSIAAGTTADLTATVSGVAVGDQAVVMVTSRNSSMEAGLVVTGFISGANTVTVRMANISAGAVDPANSDYMIRVIY